MLIGQGRFRLILCTACEVLKYTILQHIFDLHPAFISAILNVTVVRFCKFRLKRGDHQAVGGKKAGMQSCTNLQRSGFDQFNVDAQVLG